MQKTLSLLAWPVVLVFFLTACSSSAPSPQPQQPTPAVPAVSKEPIKIGFLAPLTGTLAQGAVDTVNGFKQYWDSVGNQAGGRPIQFSVADYACDADRAIAQARRLVSKEKVHMIVGPLCSQAGPGVAQVSKETGVPVIMHVASADAQTKWARTETVIRTGGSGSQYTQPFGDYLYNEAGCRNLTSLATDYTFGQENMLGTLGGYELAGGKVLKKIWFPLGTKDFSPVLAGIPPEADCVVVTSVGAEQARLFEDWFNFGYDQKFKVFGSWWLTEDSLPTMDDRAIGLIGASHAFFSGIQTPEAEAFVNDFAAKFNRLPSFYAATSYDTAHWLKLAIDSINGDVEETQKFLTAVRKTTFQGVRGPLRLDSYDNPIQNIYVAQIQKIDNPVLGKVLVPVPIKEYEDVSQFWTIPPEEYLERGPYKR